MSKSPRSEPIRLGIVGITGRLGALCAREAAKDLRFGAITGLSRSPASRPGCTDDPDIFAKNSDVILDVSHFTQIQKNAPHFVSAKRPWVIGVTGLGAKERQVISAAAKHIPILVAANFSPALAAFTEAAAKLARKLAEYDAEIAETHHRDKQDAPSGTALAIGRVVAEARGERLEDVQTFSHKGGRKPGSIGFSSTRGGNVIGEHSLRFLGEQEEIMLSHRAFDRSLFAHGALKAALWLANPSRLPGLYAMKDTLV